MCRDLRSPEASIQGFLTAMLDGTIPPEKQERYLRIVLEESQRLSRLAEGIVDMSRAQDSKIVLEETDFDLNEIIRENCAVLEPQMEEKGMRIEVSFATKETMVHADQDKISRVLHNLMNNAVKFSKEGGVIEVETTFSGKNKILVSVKDHGSGISEEDQKYIFDRFYKVDSTRNKDKTGAGLGLSIVREFIQAHGETVAVKSKLGERQYLPFHIETGRNKKTFMYFHIFGLKALLRQMSNCSLKKKKVSERLTEETVWCIQNCFVFNRNRKIAKMKQLLLKKTLFSFSLNS